MRAVPRNSLYVSATGSVEQVDQASGVREGLYRLDGKLVPAPSSDPLIPAALAGPVDAITGLDGALSLARPRSQRPPGPPPIGHSVGPCSHWWGEEQSSSFPNPLEPGAPLPWIVCGYTPRQVDSAYRIDELHRRHVTGRHASIAIVGAFESPTIRADAEAFARRYALPPLGRSYRQLEAPGTSRFPRDPAD